MPSYSISIFSMNTPNILKYFVILLFTGTSMVGSPVINDHALRSKLHRSLIELVEREDHVSGKELAEDLKTSQGAVLQIEPYNASHTQSMDYDKQVHGVVLVGSVYKCDNCDKWHLGGVATAWVLSEDGLMVTNSHVFEHSKSEAFGVLTFEGKFAEIVKVESANRSADIAVFRVEGSGFSPLPVANTVSVGDAVHVISHPDNRFYTYTSGHVSRLYSKHTHRGELPATWLSITADFARGSSGGPVLNDQGAVVGMVSRTDTIYYFGKNPKKWKNGEPDKGPSQMVIKNCVSLHEIQSLLGNEPKVGSGHPKQLSEQVKPGVVAGVPMLRPSAQRRGVQPVQAIQGMPLVPMKGAPTNQQKGPGPESLVGKPLPDFILPVIDGSELSKESLSGKVLLVDFWASWCGPCLAASPVLQAMHEEFSDRGLVVIGANTSERNKDGEITKTSKVAKSYARKKNYTYTFTYGSDDFKDACRVRGLPTMLVVDRDGTVRDVIVGFSKDLKNILSDKIKPLL